MSILLKGAADKVRKDYPVLTGVLDYFPDALLAIAEVSRLGNEQHNPGQPLHWAKEKSTDHGNTAVRHIIQRGTRDSDGGRHTAKAAWRILAMLQTEIETEARIAEAMAEDEHNEAVVQEYVSAGMGDADRRVGPANRRIKDYDVRTHKAGEPWPWDIRGDGMTRVGATRVLGVRRYGRRSTDPKVA